MRYKQNTPNKSKRSRKKLIILLTCVVLALIAATLLWINYSRGKSIDDQKAKDEAQTSSAKKSAESELNSDVESKPVSPSGELKQDVPSSTNRSVSITSASQADGNVTAVAKLSDGNGDCIFTYTIEQDKPVIRRATTTNSVCTASAPEVEFSRLGVWTLNVTAYVDGKKMEANQNVTIN